MGLGITVAQLRKAAYAVIASTQSVGPGRPRPGLSLIGGAHGHRFGNRIRPARAWSADRARGHLSDDVLSFRMSKRSGWRYRHFFFAHSSSSSHFTAGASPNRA